MNKIINSYSIRAGLLAPVFYIILVSTLGLLEPDFSHKTDMMSILGGVEGTRGVVFNLGVAITGLLLILFAYGLHKNINKGAGSKAGPFLIVLASFGFVGSAIFSCNVNCLNVIESRTVFGTLHMISAFVAGSCLATSPFFIYFRMKDDPLWKQFRNYTLSVGILSNIPGLLLWISLFTVRIPEWEGVLQRLGLLFPLIWIFSLSIHQLPGIKSGRLSTL